MTDTFIHDGQNPDCRPATEEEIAAVLGGMVAAVLGGMTADGTSILDIYNQTRDQD